MVRVHILNVGHGDCIIIEFPSGRLTVVDINRTEEMDANSLIEIVGHIDPAQATLNRILFNIGVLDYSTLFENAGYDIKLTDPIFLGTEFPVFEITTCTIMAILIPVIEWLVIKPQSRHCAFRYAEHAWESLIDFK